MASPISLYPRPSIPNPKVYAYSNWSTHGARWYERDTCVSKNIVSQHCSSHVWAVRLKHELVLREFQVTAALRECTLGSSVANGWAETVARALLTSDATIWQWVIYLWVAYRAQSSSCLWALWRLTCLTEVCFSRAVTSPEELDLVDLVLVKDQGRRTIDHRQFLLDFNKRLRNHQLKIRTKGEWRMFSSSLLSLAAWLCWCWGAITQVGSLHDKKCLLNTKCKKWE